MSDQSQTEYPYNVKIEDTSSGVRVSVHVYARDNRAADEAVSVYERTLKKLKEKEIVIAAVKTADGITHVR